MSNSTYGMPVSPSDRTYGMPVSTAANNSAPDNDLRRVKIPYPEEFITWFEVEKYPIDSNTGVLAVFGPFVETSANQNILLSTLKAHCSDHPIPEKEIEHTVEDLISGPFPWVRGSRVLYWPPLTSKETAYDRPAKCQRLSITRHVEHNKTIAEAIKGLTGEESMILFTVRDKVVEPGLCLDSDNLVDEFKPHLHMSGSKAGWVRKIATFLKGEDAIGHAKNLLETSAIIREKLKYPDPITQTAVALDKSGGWVGVNLNSKRNVRDLVMITVVKVCEGERQNYYE